LICGFAGVSLRGSGRDAR